jgi:hypothetical protein
MAAMDSRYWRADGKFYQPQLAKISEYPQKTQKDKEWLLCNADFLEGLKCVPGLGKRAIVALNVQQPVMLNHFIQGDYNANDVCIITTSGLLCHFLKLRVPGYDLEDTEQAFYRWLWIDKQIGGNLHTIVHAVSRRIVLQGLWYFVDECQECGAQTS